MLKERLPYDEKRVFVTGHSNGGGMAFRLGAEMPQRLAALAPVASLMAVKDPKPAQPLPTLFIIGTQDPLQPLAGGTVTLPWGKRVNPPVSESLIVWATAIGCETLPKTLSEKDGLKRVEYPSKSHGPTLKVIYIEGQGHTWPGQGHPAGEYDGTDHRAAGRYGCDLGVLPDVLAATVSVPSAAKSQVKEPGPKSGTISAA